MYGSHIFIAHCGYLLLKASDAIHYLQMNENKRKREQEELYGNKRRRVIEGPKFNDVDIVCQWPDSGRDVQTIGGLKTMLMFKTEHLALVTVSEDERILIYDIKSKLLMKTILAREIFKQNKSKKTLHMAACESLVVVYGYNGLFIYDTRPNKIVLVRDFKVDSAFFLNRGMIAMTIKESEDYEYGWFHVFNTVGDYLGPLPDTEEIGHEHGYPAAWNNWSRGECQRPWKVSLSDECRQRNLGPLLYRPCHNTIYYDDGCDLRSAVADDDDNGDYDKRLGDPERLYKSLKVQGNVEYAIRTASSTIMCVSAAQSALQFGVYGDEERVKVFNSNERGSRVSRITELGDGLVLVSMGVLSCIIDTRSKSLDVSHRENGTLYKSDVALKTGGYMRATSDKVIQYDKHFVKGEVWDIPTKALSCLFIKAYVS